MQGRLPAGLAMLLTVVFFAGAAFASTEPLFLWGEGTAKFVVKNRGNRIDAMREALVQQNVPLWQGAFTSNSVTYSYTMVGTDPSFGSETTVIPVVLIPIKFVFSDATRLNPKTVACGDTESALQRTLNSPLFQDYPFFPGPGNAGPVTVGTTQYIDAFQRANFWKQVQTFSPDYHVLFSVDVVPQQRIAVSGANGTTMTGPCARIGLVDIDFFDQVAQDLIRALAIPPTSLPLFLDYNTLFYELSRSNCCILGYHGVTSDNQTYAVAVYSDPGLFGSSMLQDVHALSHELAEWADDPFGDNATPGWSGGQATACQFNLEVGDPVSGVGFQAALNGKTYHLQDLVFLPWFARKAVSKSISGQYTFLGTYQSPPNQCF